MEHKAIAPGTLPPIKTSRRDRARKAGAPKPKLCCGDAKHVYSKPKLFCGDAKHVSPSLSTSAVNVVNRPSTQEVNEEWNLMYWADRTKDTLIDDTQDQLAMLE